MKIYIHRGQNQIGGSIIEITTKQTRLFFDVGIELEESSINEIPQIDGLFTGEKNCDGVLISHYHADHIGLLENLLPDIPVYMGERAFGIYKASADYRNLPCSFEPKFIHNKENFVIGDVEITPYLCDHSAFDSYMFLIKADGKTELYTGDYRANGRLSFDELLKDLPVVDAIIAEGTTLTRENSKGNIDEQRLEEIATNYLQTHNGPVFIMMSAMNIDRLVTAYNVAQKTDRVFLEDIYTAEILSSANSVIPSPSRKQNVRVFMTGGDNQYEKLQQFGNAKIGKTEISKSKFVMCIRSSMGNYLNKLNELMSFENGVLFYGMWKGYLEQPETKEFVEMMQSKGVKLHILHTSGHADAQTIDKLIKDVQPKIIIPVHTENAEWFKQYENTQVICDKNIIEV